MLLEICLDSVESALLAEKSGADRIELCSALSEGGLTPSEGLFAFCIKKISIPVRIMIRPRGGDFFYSDAEFEVMKSDVEMVKSLNPDGVVFGMLHPDGCIDVERTKELVELARPMKVTFHRAFDFAADPFDALERIIDCGCNTLLTSGQKNKAADGSTLIKQLVEAANNRIEILAGSGVTDKNIKMLMTETHATSFHMSAKKVTQSKMLFKNNNVNQGTENNSGYNYFSVDEEMIRNAKQILTIR